MLLRRTTLLGGLLLVVTAVTAHAHGNTLIRQVDLVSDLSGVAAHQDADLVNAWGLVLLPDGTFRVASTETGVILGYDATGRRVGDAINVPGGDPTGLALNHFSGAFRFKCRNRLASSTLIAVNEGGSISTARLDADDATNVQTVPDANYKGVALGSGRHGTLLYAANFHAGTIDVFDDDFNPVSLPDAFDDPNLPDGFAAWNIVNVDGYLYVAYAMQDADRADEVAGAGFGYVDVYDLCGRLVRRLVSGGALNAPWGMAVVPEGFGKFEGALLVGNFGDGRINAYSRRTGEWLGTLSDTDGNPFEIEGLWALVFSNGQRQSQYGSRHHGDEDDDDDGYAVRPALYFTAGPGDEEHGLFGVLRSESIPVVHNGDGNGKGKDKGKGKGKGKGNGRYDAIEEPGLALAASVPVGLSLASGNPTSVSRHSSVDFVIATGQTARVSLDLYDVSGRLMARPLRDAEVSGSIEARWNRRDPSGATVPYGTYFYRVAIGPETRSGRFVIMP